MKNCLQYAQILMEKRRRDLFAVICILAIFWISGYFYPVLSGAEVDSLSNEQFIKATDLILRKDGWHYRFRLQNGSQFISKKNQKDDDMLWRESMSTVEERKLLPMGVVLRVRARFFRWRRAHFPEEWDEEKMQNARGLSGELQISDFFSSQPEGKAASAEQWMHLSISPQLHPTRIRQRIQEALEQRFHAMGGQSGLFLKRVLLGTQEEGFSFSETMKGVGLAHLLAASGLHVNMLFQLGLHLLAFFPLRRKCIDLVLFLFLFLYAWILSFPASFVRAFLFLLLRELSSQMGRNIRNIRRFGLALFLLCAFRPYRIHDTGLQLSFLCVLAMEVSAKRGKHRNRLIHSLQTTLWIHLWTLPVLSSMNARWDPVQFIANFLAVPFFSTLLAAGLGAFLLYTVPVLGIIVHMGYRLLWFLFQALILGLEASKIGSPEMPLFHGMEWKLLYYAALIVFCRRKKFSFRWILMETDLFRRRFSKKIRRELVRFLFCFMLFQEIFFLGKGLTGPVFRAVDVNQGDCFLLEWEGRFALFDTGGERDPRTRKNTQARALIRRLRSYGVRRLEAVFLSHKDYDHTGNAAEIMQSIPTRVLFHAPVFEEKTPKESAAESVCFFQTGQRILLGGRRSPVVTVLRAGRWDAENTNAECAVWLLSMGENSRKPATVLLLGDYESAEEKLWKGYLHPPLSLLKVSHHGSAKGTGNDLLMGTRPKRAVISCGVRNRYGHPKPITLERLQSAGIQIDRTDYSGTLNYYLHPFSKKGDLLVINEKTERLLEGGLGLLCALLYIILQKRHFSTLKSSGGR